MTEVLEIEKIEKNPAFVNNEKDTWILKLPDEVCRREGFADGTMISLTFKNGAVKTSIIRHSIEIDNFVDSVIYDEKEFFEDNVEN